MKIRSIAASQKIFTTENEIAILIDILRASSTITATLFHEAKEIIPISEVQEAFQSARENNAILMGERNCIKINNFDLGNSPVEISKEKVRDRTVVFTSTNFPKTISLSKKSPLVLIGSFLNLNVITKYAYDFAEKNHFDICFVLAGNSKNSNDEDLAFAGASALFISKYKDIFPDKNIKKAIDFVSKNGIENCVLNSPHARKLINLGFLQDVKFSVMLDKFNIIPILRDNKITRL